MMDDETEEERERRMLAQAEVIGLLESILPDAWDVLGDLELEELLSSRKPGRDPPNSVPWEEKLLRRLLHPHAATKVPLADPGHRVPGVLAITREGGRLVVQIRRTSSEKRAISAIMVIRSSENQWVFPVQIGQQTRLDTILDLGTDAEVFELLRPIREGVSDDDRQQLLIDFVLEFDEGDDPPDR